MDVSPDARVLVAVFASGAGSNAQKIIEYAADRPETAAFQVRLIVCNKPAAGVLEIAAAQGIETLLIERTRFLDGDGYLPELRNRGIGFIVLAGFLWKLPSTLIQAYPDRILNIHPALLPKYGGKGMYGARVHEAVLAGQEAESGITIHYVDEVYDHGNILFQAVCAVDKDDTPESLAEKVHRLEHQHYPEVINAEIKKQNRR